MIRSLDLLLVVLGDLGALQLLSGSEHTVLSRPAGSVKHVRYDNLPFLGAEDDTLDHLGTLETTLLTSLEQLLQSKLLDLGVIAQLLKRAFRLETGLLALSAEMALVLRSAMQG